MEKGLQIFKHEKFGEVRVIEMNGEPMFAATEVAKCLGYENPTEAVIDHCKSSNIAKCYIPHENGMGGVNVNFIPEGEVYRLIMHSKLPTAEKFQDWVCYEVLPAIRKEGLPVTSSLLVAQKFGKRHADVLRVIRDLEADVAEISGNEHGRNFAFMQNTKIKKNMDNKGLQIFKHEKFGEVRVIEMNGEPMFVAKDVAKVLGYEDTDQAIRMHCKTGDPLKWGVCYVPHSNGIGGTNMVIIGDSNVYRLIMRSKMPKAEEFQDWVCGEVLPSIRKHGFYLSGANVEDLKSYIRGYIDEKLVENHGQKPSLPPLDVREDTEAYRYFDSYRISDEVYLDKLAAREYYSNACVLNAIGALMKREYGVRGYSRKFCQTIFWHNAVELVRRVEVENFPHSLPENPRKLRAKYMNYLQGGYKSLVHKGVGNNNARKRR